MLRATMTRPKTIVFEDIAIPAIKDNEVLLKIKRIGVCGSDIHVFHGKHPYTTYPVVQGHEIVAIVESIGATVTSCKVGHMVTVQPQVFCGICRPCLDGNYNICQNLKVMGFQTNGMAQEYFAIEAEKIIPLPDSMDVDDGALVEPLAVGVHAVRKSGDVAGKNILVLGAGPIGNLTAQAAKAAGAKNVVITDISDFRIQKAKECGIDMYVNTAKKCLSGVVKKYFDRQGADLIFECVGTQKTIEDVLPIARKGTMIMIVGVFGEKPLVDLGLVQDHELTLKGTLMYKKEDYIEAIRFINEKAVYLKPLVTKHFTFREYHAAYKYIEENREKSMKILIDLP